VQIGQDPLKARSVEKREIAAKTLPLMLRASPNPENRLMK
jgi:hypothetical protein